MIVCESDYNPGTMELNGELVIISNLTYANSYNGMIIVNQGDSVCNSTSTSSHKGCSVIMSDVITRNFTTSYAGFSFYNIQNSLFENNQITSETFSLYNPTHQHWSNVTVRNSDLATALVLVSNGVRLENITNIYNTFLQGSNNLVQNCVFDYPKQGQYLHCLIFCMYLYICN